MIVSYFIEKKTYIMMKLHNIDERKRFMYEFYNSVSIDFYLTKYV